MNNLATDSLNDLNYLRQKYPHLYDIQMQVLRVIDQSGYGDVSVVLTIQNGVVEKGEILGSARKLYYRRVDNKFERLEVPLDVENVR